LEDVQSRGRFGQDVDEQIAWKQRQGDFLAPVAPAMHLADERKECLNPRLLQAKVNALLVPCPGVDGIPMLAGMNCRGAVVRKFSYFSHGSAV
jgi:hypothetical protein